MHKDDMLLDGTGWIRYEMNESVSIHFMPLNVAKAAQQMMLNLSSPSADGLGRRINLGKLAFIQTSAIKILYGRSDNAMLQWFHLWETMAENRQILVP